MSVPSTTPSPAVAEGATAATPAAGTAHPQSEVRMTGRQKLVLALLLGAQFMIAVDFSILNVALPAVGEGLGFALTNLQWIATAFALAAAGFTLLFGRVADIVGRKRLFLCGMAVLGAASSSADSPPRPKSSLWHGCCRAWPPRPSPRPGSLC